jgi:hypothetical protein
VHSNPWVILNSLSGGPETSPPVFIESLNEDEQKKSASFISHFFSPPWKKTDLPPGQFLPTGIVLEYVNEDDSGGSPLSEAGNLATKLCENLKADGVAVKAVPTHGKGDNFVGMPPWPPGIPSNALIISVGERPNRFWTNRYLQATGRPLYDQESACTKDELIQEIVKEQRRYRGGFDVPGVIRPPDP